MKKSEKNLREIINRLLEENAKAVGVDSIAFDTYEFHENDLDWIVEEFGRKPTAKEWWEAGWSESAIKAFLPSDYVEGPRSID